MYTPTRSEVNRPIVETKTRHACCTGHAIDLCIKNAIVGVQGQNTYARLKGSADLLEDRHKRALA
jgi:hypothetical protein